MNGIFLADWSFSSLMPWFQAALYIPSTVIIKIKCLRTGTYMAKTSGGYRQSVDTA